MTNADVVVVVVHVTVIIVVVFLPRAFTVALVIVADEIAHVIRDVCESTPNHENARLQGGNRRRRSNFDRFRTRQRRQRTQLTRRRTRNSNILGRYDRQTQLWEGRRLFWHLFFGFGWWFFVDISLMR